MSAVEQLPADQRAVLSLLLRQRRSYAQIASMLAIDAAAVRGRAQLALAALGGTAPSGLDDEQLAKIGDYVLGQQREGERIETLALLMVTPPARAWARRLAAQIEPIATAELPAVPPEPAAERPVNRGGGVLLIAAALIAAAIAVVLVRSGGSTPAPPGPIPASAATAASTSTTASAASTTTSNGVSVVAEIRMHPTAGGSHATGAVAILSTGSGLELAFSARNLPAPGRAHYVLWLYDSPAHFQALGRIQSITNGAVGPLGVRLPPDASSYHGVALTLETSSAPARPAAAVLLGAGSSPL